MDTDSSQLVESETGMSSHHKVGKAKKARAVRWSGTKERMSPTFHPHQHHHQHTHMYTGKCISQEYACPFTILEMGKTGQVALWSEHLVQALFHKKVRFLTTVCRLTLKRISNLYWIFLFEYFPLNNSLKENLCLQVY